MGHPHCICKTVDSEVLVSETGSCRLHELHTKPPGNLMIHPEVHPLKAHPEVQVKKRRLESNRGESINDPEILQSAMTHLEESGWYWGSITAAEAKQLLIEAMDGSFLIRDSANPGYLLTLSVKTSLGPTHLRIEYSNGYFGFDSVLMARPHLRQFKGVVDLVQFYTLAYRRQAAQKAEAVDQDTRRTAENTMRLQLMKPLHKTVSSLQHLCRVVINQHSHSHQDLPLPGRLKDFLRDYPFVF